MTADAEALCELLKMKKTGSKTKRPCWACNVSCADMKTKFDVEGLNIRTVASTEDDCRRITDPNLTPQGRLAAQMDTGVRGRSAMLDIPGFEFTSVCFDSMHCVLEGGLLELVFKDFVREMVETDVITLDELNERIRNYEFKMQPGDVRPPSCHRK